MHSEVKKVHNLHTNRDETVRVSFSSFLSNSVIIIIV